MVIAAGDFPDQAVAELLGSGRAEALTPEEHLRVYRLIREIPG